jgi:SAM-dependent methyltransferase
MWPFKEKSSNNAIKESFENKRKKISAINSGDEYFDVRYNEIPQIIIDWLPEGFSWENANVMDYGCGYAIMALSFAEQMNCGRVMAVDTAFDFDEYLDRAKKARGIECWPNNLEIHKISPGDIPGEQASIDLIYSWSVFEHVDERYLKETFKKLVDLLKPGGYIFIQISPLFYSAEGSHLLHKVNEPWGHLMNQMDIYREKLRDNCISEEEFNIQWAEYQALNRLTANELRSLLIDSGVIIVREHMTQAAQEPAQKLIDIYNLDVLKTDQIVLLGQKL